MLTGPRDTLYARINARYDAMVENGGLEEARAVFARGFDETLPMMKAIGLRQLSKYFNGLEALSEAIDDAKRESRRFAKRQSTWFRNQPPTPVSLPNAAARDSFKASLIGLTV